MTSRHPLDRLSAAVEGAVTTVTTLAGAGLARPLTPAATVRAALALARGGITPVAACGIGSARFATEPALVDDVGTLSFAQLDRRVRDLADTFAGIGVGRGDRIGVLCRTHRGFVEATVALSSLGADVVFLNTSFAPPQAGAVVVQQRLTGLVHDDEFAPHARDARDATGGLRTWRARTDADGPSVDVPGSVRHRFRIPPLSPGRFVLLTSGSTGEPKGAARSVPRSLDPLVALLDRMPLHVRDVTLVSSPLFHAWGFGQLGLGLVLSSTIVVQERFDPEAVLAAVERHRVRVLTLVPVMVKRLVELPEPTRRRYDTSSLAVVASSGAHLPGSLAARFMDLYGDVLYNVYGSTEEGWAAIATPHDLRSAPGTVGTPPWRTEVRIVDGHGAVVPTAMSGGIVVRSRLLVEGVDGGRRGPATDGYQPTGDVGRIDEHGRLFVEGRQDDMIVSGGENVYPQEVEELIARHPAVADVAVVAVDDAEFGQRLRALVVRRGDAALSEDVVRAYVRDHLARYKVPREVRFLDKLPHNDVGKLVRTDPHRN